MRSKNSFVAKEFDTFTGIAMDGIEFHPIDPENDFEDMEQGVTIHEGTIRRNRAYSQVLDDDVTIEEIHAVTSYDRKRKKYRERRLIVELENMQVVYEVCLDRGQIIDTDDDDFDAAVAKKRVMTALCAAADKNMGF